MVLDHLRSVVGWYPEGKIGLFEQQKQQRGVREEVRGEGGSRPQQGLWGRVRVTRHRSPDSRIVAASEPIENGGGQSGIRRDKRRQPPVLGKIT
jgi:hypothetical protein